MADRLADVRARFGPLALAGAVSGAFFSRGLTVALLMRSLGSPNWLINQDLCGGCRALSDRIAGLAIERGEDVEATRCALVVGRNPSAADPAQALKRAKARGARIIIVDPKRIPLPVLAPNKTLFIVARHNEHLYQSLSRTFAGNELRRRG